jgi:signal transduction histidine kinase
MNNSIRRSLSAKLGFTILLLAIPIFIASLGIMFLQSRRLVRHTAMDRAVSALNATMQRVELHLSVVETSTSSNSWMATTYLTPDSLMAISRSIVTLNPHTSGCSIATEPDLFPQYGRHFSVCSVRQGDTVITVREAPYEYFQNSWYKIPKTQGKACWIDPSDGIREGALNRKDTIVSYCKPLYRDGRFIGVISTDLSLRMLNEIVVREHPYPNSYFIMAGADGHVLIHPDTTQLFTNTLFSDIENSQQKDIVALGREMTAGNKGTMLINIDGASCLVCYQPVSGTPWSLALISPESDILKGYYILANILVPLILVGLLLILLFCQRSVRHAITPLYRLLAISQQIATGQYDAVIPYSKRKDVVGRLQNSFATMQESLKHRVEDVRRVAKETTLRNEELTKATQLAEEADRQKTAFIQNMTHQIRTPLNIITGFSQVLRDSFSMLPEEELKNVKGLIDYNAKTLNRMVLMLFDSSDSGFSEELNCRQNEDVSCNEVARESIANMQLYYPDMPVKLEFELPETFRIHTNRLYLMRSLRELLYNAAKYSDKQHVTLRVKQTDTKVQFIVEDKGPGIAEDFINLLYEPFVKVNDLSEGLGLGLPLTKRHALNLGGDLVLDTDYRDGSRFILWLPKK